MCPRSGGVYVHVREGFGRLPAFLFGWTELVLIRASALGAIATPFAEYLLRALGYNREIEPYATTVHWVAAAAIAATATVNYVGLNWSSLLLNLTTGVKYGALVLLVVLGFAAGQGDFAHFAQAAGSPSTGLFGLALVSVLWAYDGWGDLSFVGGEVRDPERNMPRALLLGTAGVIAIYLLVNATYLYLLPIDRMAHSPLVAADAAQLIVGQIGVGLVAVVVMVATFSTLLGSILTSPRIFFAMAEDRLFFKAVARVHPRFQTPSVAIVVTALLGVVFVLLRTFAQLADQLRVVPPAAQGVTSAAVSGRLTDESHAPVEQAVVNLINTSNGQRYSTRSSSDGRFYFENAQVGGPYTLEVRALGFAPEQATGVTLALGQRFVRDFSLKRTAVEVAGLTVSGNANPLLSP